MGAGSACAEKKIYPVPGGTKRYQPVRNGTATAIKRPAPVASPEGPSCLDGRAPALQLSKNLRQRLLPLTLFKLSVPTRLIRTVLLTVTATAPKPSSMSLIPATKKVLILNHPR